MALSFPHVQLDPFTCLFQLSADAIPQTELEKYKFLLFSQKKPQEEMQKVCTASQRVGKIVAIVLMQEMALASAIFISNSF